MPSSHRAWSALFSPRQSPQRASTPSLELSPGTVRPVTGRAISIGDLVSGSLPEDLTGVEWSDGTVECRAAVAANVLGGIGRDTGDVGRVLVAPSVVCDSCSERCG